MGDLIAGIGFIVIVTLVSYLCRNVGSRHKESIIHKIILEDERIKVQADLLEGAAAYGDIGVIDHLHKIDALRYIKGYDIMRCIAAASRNGHNEFVFTLVHRYIGSPLPHGGM